jgi:hypothetical protein
MFYPLNDHSQHLEFCDWPSLLLSVVLAVWMLLQTDRSLFLDYVHHITHQYPSLVTHPQYALDDMKYLIIRALLSPTKDIPISIAKDEQFS